MERGRGEFGLKSVEELRVGPQSEKAVAESIRAKVRSVCRLNPPAVVGARTHFTAPASCESWWFDKKHATRMHSRA